MDVFCMACSDTTCNFKPVMLQRRTIGDFDILISMKYCGVCHSDLHSASGHLDGVIPTVYSISPHYKYFSPRHNSPHYKYSVLIPSYDIGW